MNIHKLRTVLIAGLVAVCSLGTTTQAQTITVNNTVCSGATVTFGGGAIAINTASCGITPPTVNASTPPVGTIGAFYSHPFSAGGATPITWSSTGSLPPGLALNASTGVLSGTPTTATGSPFSFSVTAANSAGSSAALSTSIAVAPPSGPPVIQNTAPSTATVGTPYSFQYTATGAAGITYTVTAGSPPPGITLTTGGLLSGTPTTATGSPFAFTVTATNGNLPNATPAVSITVTAPVAPTITSAAPPAGTTNSAYTFPFTASGTQPITWSSTGSLPPGVTLNASTGVLSGTPTTTTGSPFSFTVTASNGTLPNATSTNYSLAIAPPVIQTGAILMDIAGNVIPTPVSKLPTVVPAVHSGLNGGGSVTGQEFHGWAPDPARCSGTPAITRYWYHNINILDYGLQSAKDYLDFAPNQAVTYGFVPATPATNNSQVGRIMILTGPNATPASTFVSISTSPCDFDVSRIAAADPCFKTGASENGMMFQITSNATSAMCKLTPGVQYYLNLRFQDARTNGAPNADACAAALPAGYSTCGALLQIQTY